MTDFNCQLVEDHNLRDQNMHPDAVPGQNVRVIVFSLSNFMGLGLLFLFLLLCHLRL